MWSGFSQISLKEYLLLQINEKVFSKEASESKFLFTQKVEKDEDSLGFSISRIPTSSSLSSRFI